MKLLSWRSVSTALAAGVFVLALIPDADAQRGGGRGGGARGGGGGGGGGFSRGGPASGGGFSAGGGRQQAQKADVGSRQGTSTANQGQRQDARGERQGSRQDAAGDRQSNRQDSYSSSGDSCNNCWDGAAVAAGVAAGAIVAGAAASAAQPAPTTYVNQAPQQVAPPCNVAPIAVSGVPYYKCGATWYTAGYGSAGVVYMPVPPPPGN
jgi:hypothetical protein